MKCVIILFDIEFYNVGAPSELTLCSSVPEPSWIYLWIYVFYNNMMGQDAYNIQHIWCGVFHYMWDTCSVH